MKTKFTAAFFLILFSFSMQTSAQDSLSANNADKVPPLWGAFASLGVGVQSGNAAEYFSTSFLLPITLDFAYKNLYLQLNFDGGWGKVSKTMTFTDTKSWNEGDNVFFNAVGFNAGFSVINNSSFRLTPFAGYATVYSSKKWFSGSDISDYEPNTQFYNVGILLDFKNYLVSNGKKDLAKYDGYTGIRISVGAYIQAEDYPAYSEYYDGSVYYFSIGVPILGTWEELTSD